MVNVSNILKKDLHHLNAIDLLKEIEWFNKVVDTRMKINFGQDCDYKSIYDITAPDHDEDESVFAEFISFYKLSFNERIILMLALVPHIYPQLLDVFFSRNQNIERGHTEFGGLKGTAHSGFLPTGETALFLLAGNDLNRRFKLQQLFDADHPFRQHNIIYLSSSPANEPYFSR